SAHLSVAAGWIGRDHGGLAQSASRAREAVAGSGRHVLDHRRDAAVHPYLALCEPRGAPAHPQGSRGQENLAAPRRARATRCAADRHLSAGAILTDEMSIPAASFRGAAPDQVRGRLRGEPGTYEHRASTTLADFL